MPIQVNGRDCHVFLHPRCHLSTFLLQGHIQNLQQQCRSVAPWVYGVWAVALSGLCGCSDSGCRSTYLPTFICPEGSVCLSKLPLLPPFHPRNSILLPNAALPITFHFSAIQTANLPSQIGIPGNGNQMDVPVQAGRLANPLIPPA